MNKINKLLKNNHIRMALILLIVSLFAFGPFIRDIGFYWDDWGLLFTSWAADIDLYQRFFGVDRPYTYWTFAIFTPVLGVNPIHWQLLNFILRWAASWFVWKFLIELWPKQNAVNMWIAILYLVYPSFFQHPSSVTYHSYWLMVVVLMSSFLFMFAAYRNPDRKFIFTFFGIFFMGVHFSKSEYFVGLELLRPVLLFIYTFQIENKPNIKRIIKYWSPYFVAWLGFVYWRLFILNVPNNETTIIFDFVENPFQTSILFFETVVQNLLQLWIVVWTDILNPESIIFQSKIVLFSWGITFISSILLYLALLKFKSSIKNRNIVWQMQALILGSMISILGYFPAWITGRGVFYSSFSDRFSLSALLGASMIIVAVIDYIVYRPQEKILIISILIGLSVGAQLRSTQDYRWDWIHQTRYYWQLYWRAPHISPNTALISEGAITRTQDEYLATMAINMLYFPKFNEDELPLWFMGFSDHEEITVENVQKFISGVPLQDSFRNYTFNGNSFRSLFLYHEDKSVQCLWFLGPQDINNEQIPLPMRQIATVANYDLISDNPSVDIEFLEKILGPEPKNTWCYFYQKAELARQLGDWDEVVSLAQQAEQAKVDPNYGVEYLTFIEAYARQENWQRAEELSWVSYFRIKGSLKMLCEQWKGFQSQYAGQPEFETVYENLAEKIKCLND